MSEFKYASAQECIAAIGAVSSVSHVDFIFTDNNGHEISMPALQLVSFGDYHGNDYDAANYRALKEEFGDIFYTSSGYCNWLCSHHGGAESLFIVIAPGMPPFAMYAEMDARDVLDTLRRLAELMSCLDENPLINEQVHFNYIMELAEEAWNQYLWYDIMSELDEMSSNHWSSDNLTDKEIESFRAAYYEYDNEWVAESATSVVNLRHDEAVWHAASTVLGWFVMLNNSENDSRRFWEEYKINRGACRQRIGQAMFNALSIVDTGKADEIRGSMLDPFYDDSRIYAFLAYIGETVDSSL